MSTLSKRGQACIRPLPPYMVKSFEAWNNTFHPSTNPSGYINLSIAENLLSLPLVAEHLSSFTPIPVDSLSYGSPKAFIATLANFLSKYLTNRPVNPSHIAVLNGASVVIEALATVICDSGDRVLTTGPGYRGLELDVSARAETEIVTACLEGIGETERDPKITVDALEEAWIGYGGEESRIRMVLICSPNNPTGEVLSRETILEIVEWGKERNLHLVFDELYAKSVYGDDVKFVSVADVMDGNMGDMVHIVWSFSKDLCLSGCRVGAVYSQNEDLIQSVNAFLSFFGMPSRNTQWSLGELLKDEEWLEGFFEENKRRLAKAYQKVAAILETLDVPYMKADAGFFVWVDLRKWMKGPTEEDEMELWRMILETKVVLTPSGQCFGRRFGYFRVCFAAVDAETFELTCQRLAVVLKDVAN